MENKKEEKHKRRRGTRETPCLKSSMECEQGGEHASREGGARRRGARETTCLTSITECEQGGEHASREGGARRRGAPLNNHNALTHGFYSRSYSRFTRADLDGHAFEGLADEITSLRVLIRNILERANETTSLEEALNVLRGVSVGFFSLARLVRTHHIINGSDSDLRDALKEALDRVRVDLKLVPPIK